MSTHVITSATGKYKTTCRLCRRAVAESPALDIPIVGDPGKRGKELMQVLTKHVGKHHPKEFNEGASLLDETLSFLVLSAFDYEDPSITPRVEAIRARIFAKVRKITFDDENIQKLIDALGLEPDDWEKVNAAMRALRDACCELGAYAPEVSEQSKIIPA